MHSKYKGDVTSGYDIALIGIGKDDYKNIEMYIYNNQDRLSENERKRQSTQYFFKDNNLFQKSHDEN